MKKFTIEDFQKKVNEASIESLQVLEYSSAHEPVRIKCKQCGHIYYYTQASNALNSLKSGRGICKTCYKEPKKLQSFINKLHELFPDADFTVLEFNGNTKSCVVKCNKCGNIIHMVHAKQFFHKKYFCNKCDHPVKRPIREKRIDSFRKFFESEECNWDLVSDLSDVTTLDDNVTCRCKKCGKNTSRPIKQYLDGRGCKYCTNHARLTTEEFKQRLDDDYELLSEYHASNEKVLLRHKKCGFVFKMTPSCYTSGGQRCPRCRRSKSKGEETIEKILKENDIDFIEQYPIVLERHRLRVDFYLPIVDVYIEFQGIQHYKEDCFNRTHNGFLQDVARDDLKRKYLGDKLLEIKYNENIQEKISSQKWFNDYRETE